MANLQNLCRPPVIVVSRWEKAVTELIWMQKELPITHPICSHFLPYSRKVFLHIAKSIKKEKLCSTSVSDCRVLPFSCFWSVFSSTRFGNMKRSSEKTNHGRIWNKVSALSKCLERAGRMDRHGSGVSVVQTEFHHSGKSAGWPCEGVVRRLTGRQLAVRWCGMARTS